MHPIDQPLLKVQRDFKRLILPYLLTFGVLVCNAFFLHFIVRSDHSHILPTLWGGGGFPTGFHEKSLRANSYPIWFLCALFWCRILFNASYIKLGRRATLIIAPIISVLVIWLYNKWLIDLPFALVVGLSALIYYEAGLLIKQYGKRVNRKLLLAVFAFWLMTFRFVKIDMVVCEYSNFFFAFLVSLCGTVGIYVLSKGLTQLKSIKLFSVVPEYLTWLGSGSMVVLCVHTVERCYPVWQVVGISDRWIIFLCRMVLYTLTLYLFGRIRITSRIFGLE